MIQLDFTREIEVFKMLFYRYNSKNRESSIKPFTKYFLYKIQLDQPVEKFRVLSWASPEVHIG